MAKKACGDFVVTRIVRWNSGKKPWVVELARRQPAITWWVMLATSKSAAASKLCSQYGGRKVRVQYHRSRKGYFIMDDIELMD